MLNSRREEANRAFSAAAVLEDDSSATASSTTAVWKHWGNHLEALFLNNYSENTALNVGLQALACFLECARITSSTKSRPFIARVFWLIKMIYSAGSSLHQPLEESLKRSVGGIPAANWLFWVNEIVGDVKQRPSHTGTMTELLASVAEAYPQQVFPVLRANLDVRKVRERVAKGKWRFFKICHF